MDHTKEQKNATYLKKNLNSKTIIFKSKGSLLFKRKRRAAYRPCKLRKSKPKEIHVVNIADQIIIII